MPVPLEMQLQNAVVVVLSPTLPPGKKLPFRIRRKAHRKRSRRRIFGLSAAHRADVKPSCLRFPLTHWKQAIDSRPSFAGSFRLFRYPSINRKPPASFATASPVQQSLRRSPPEQHPRFVGRVLPFPSREQNRAKTCKKAPQKFPSTNAESMRKDPQRPQSLPAPVSKKTPPLSRIRSPFVGQRIWRGQEEENPRLTGRGFVGDSLISATRCIAECPPPFLRCRLLRC